MNYNSQTNTSPYAASPSTNTQPKNQQPWGTIGQGGWNSNAYQNQQGQVVQPWNTMLYHMHDILPWLSSQEGFASGLEPQRQAGIQNLVNSFSPGNIQAQIQHFGVGANARANQQGNQMGAMLEGQGASSGAVQGAKLDAQNQAAQSTNSYASQMQGPEGQQHILNAILGAIGQGQNMNALNPVMAFNNAYYGGYFPQNQVDMQRAQQQNALMSQLFGSLGNLGGAYISTL